MVSFYFQPAYSGSAIQALNLSTHLRDLGLSPMIVSANLADSPEYEEFEGIPLHRIRVARHRELRIPSFWISLIRFLLARRGEFDLVHAHGTLQHGSASLAAALLGKPSLLKVAMANSDIAFDRQGRVRGNLNRLMVSRFSSYIATTPDIQSEFGERGLDTAKVRLITNGVDTDTYRPLPAGEKVVLRARLGLPEGPLIAYVGIINRRKNVDGILRIWSGAVHRGARGHLILIGPLPDPTDPFMNELNQFVQAHRLGDRMTFVGRQQSAAPYLQSSDVLLFPSRQEGMPNSVLEAMACGLPVVASRSAGAESLVRHGHTGFSLELTDEDTFADTVFRLTQDDALRKDLGKNGRRFVEERYSLRAVASQYVDLYRDLLSGTSRLSSTDGEVSQQ